MQTVQGKAVFCNRHLINCSHCTYYWFRSFPRKTDPLTGLCISVLILLGLLKKTGTNSKCISFDVGT